MGCQDSGGIPATKCSWLKDVSWNSFIPIKKSQLFKKTNICTSLQVLGPKGGAGEGLVMQCLQVRGENIHYGDLLYSAEMLQEALLKKRL